MYFHVIYFHSTQLYEDQRDDTLSELCPLFLFSIFVYMLISAPKANALKLGKLIPLHVQNNTLIFSEQSDSQF